MEKLLISKKYSPQRNLFIGIDLGGKEKMTTGICILEKRDRMVFPLKIWCLRCKDIYGKEIFKEVGKYLKETKVIAIDAPLTKGKGKGKMRLYEKFLSTKIFRKENVNPIPPALMPELCSFALELRKKLEKRRFVLDLTPAPKHPQGRRSPSVQEKSVRGGASLIEVFPTLTKKICKKSFLYAGVKYSGVCKTKNQKMAFICAILANLHFNFQTRYLGWKDGLLFLPAFSFWKENWKKKFYQAWQERSRLKYRYLITNIFQR